LSAVCDTLVAAPVIALSLAVCAGATVNRYQAPTTTAISSTIASSTVPPPPRFSMIVVCVPGWVSSVRYSAMILLPRNRAP
jgi:hypothetical protein